MEKRKNTIEEQEKIEKTESQKIGEENPTSSDGSPKEEGKGTKTEVNKIEGSEDPVEEKQGQIDTPQIDMGEVAPSKVTPSRTRRGGREGVINIINSKNNGKRIGIGKMELDHLDNPDSIQMGYLGDKLLIARGSKDASMNHQLRKQSSKYLIYNSKLVLEITERLNLDFTNKVSLTLYNAEYLYDKESNPVVLVEGENE